MATSIYSIYRILRDDNEDYIGATKDLKRRVAKHERSERFATSKIKEVQILCETSSIEEADELETYFVDCLRKTLVR